MTYFTDGRYTLVTVQNELVHLLYMEMGDQQWEIMKCGMPHYESQKKEQIKRLTSLAHKLLWQSCSSHGGR